MSIAFPWGADGKKSTCNEGDLGSIPGLGRSSGEGKGYPLQYSGLEHSMDCIVHGVTKSRTRLSGFHFHFRVAESEEKLKSLSMKVRVKSWLKTQHSES